MADDSLNARGIYVIRHIEGFKIYVGSTECFRTRFNAHRHKLRNLKHHSIKLQNAWNKYGESAFAFEVVEIVPPDGNLLNREQHYIDTLCAVQRGYNVGLKASASMAGLKHTAEARAKISAAIRGVPRPSNVRFKGIKLTPEHIAKVVAAHLGSKRSEESRARMSAAMRGKQSWLGRTHSEETKRKISELAKARPHPKGHRHSQEVRDRMREASAHRRVAVEIGGIRYASFEDAALAIGCHKTNIGHMIRSGRATRL